MTIVFSQLFKMTVENFPVYVLTGTIIFNFNSESTNQALFSIIGNASLIKKVYIPKYLFPMAKVISCMVNLGFSLVALIIVMIATKSQFYPTIITIWIPLIYVLMFTLGLSLILSAVNVFFRDLGHLYSVLITAWTYLTPIFYTVDIVPNNIKKIILLNPMYHFITMFRKIILQGVFPNFVSNIVCFSIGFFTLLIGIIVFKKTQDKFILYI
jgi:ABC-2 type transport system permease protein